MNIAIIGRSEILYKTACILHEAGHKIVCIITAREAVEYTRTAEDFETLAASWKIPFAKGPNILQHADMLSSIDAEIAVSINFAGLIPQSIIDLFPLGVLNAHGGDLPRYRGNACQAWAILNAEKKIALCIHKMIGGELDSGDIITRAYLDIDHRTKITQVWHWMSELTPSLMLSAVQELAINPHYVLERQSRSLNNALRCYPRRPEDGRIDWRNNAIDILRLINASNKPYSGAFCLLEDTKLIVWDAELIQNDENFLAIPGQVTKIGSDFIEVACGQQKLRILCVETREIVCRPNDLIRSIRVRLT